MSDGDSADRLQSLFPTLKGGLHGMTPEEVNEHRRSRLLGAMVEAVARYGYQDTTVSRLVALAGISKSDFYLVFDSKEDCFWAAFDAALGRFTGQVEAIVSSARGPRAQMIATVEALAGIIAAEPAAVSLVLVDSLALPLAEDDPRGRSWRLFQALLRGAFDEEAPGVRVSDVTVRGIVFGLRRLAYRAIRDSSAEQLSAGAPALADWVLSYGTERRAPVAESRGPVALPRPTAAELSWEEPPASPASRMELSQRERIMRAIGQLSRDGGYADLTIPAISAAAGTSNETFYAEFANKQAAFLSTFDALAARALADVATAFDSGGSWPRRAEAGLAAFLAHAASEPLFAALAFEQVPRLGRSGLDRVDAVGDELESILSRDAPSLPPQLVGKALVGGIWGTIRDEVAAGRRAELRALQPRIANFAAVGFGAG
jgi:AcrR family transcriptional regulator